jgi:hypothetical protein
LVADAVLAIVLLTWRGGRVEHGHHGTHLAELARIIAGAETRVSGHSINAGASILAHVINAVINVDGAVGATEARKTLAAVAGHLVNAAGAVLARIHVLGAEIDLLLAIFAW